MATRRTPTTTTAKAAPKTDAVAVKTRSKASPTSRAKALKADSPENWDQRLGFLMHDVSRLRRTVFDGLVRPVGVTRSQWWVLAHLARHDGMIQSDLANVLDLGKAALGGLIDRLEATELVHRGPDESDRRVKRVYLSPKGSQLILSLTGFSHEMSERMLEGLDRPARQTLVEMLTRVKTNLQAMKAQLDAEGIPTDDE